MNESIRLTALSLTITHHSVSSYSPVNLWFDPPQIAIVTNVVLPLLGDPVFSWNTPLIVFDTALAVVATLKSPKSVAFPVLAIVTVSITLSNDP